MYNIILIILLRKVEKPMHRIVIATNLTMYVYCVPGPLQDSSDIYY